MSVPVLDSLRDFGVSLMAFGAICCLAFAIRGAIADFRERVRR